MSLEYRNASKIIEVGLKGQSLKKFCSGLKNLRKSEYALALQTLKYIHVIKDLLSDLQTNNNCTEIQDLEDVHKSLLYVMIYDLLFSKGHKINGGGAVKKKIVAVRGLLEEALQKKMKDKVNHEDLLSNEITEMDTLPVYIRVNTVKIALNKGLEYLQASHSPNFHLSFDPLIPSLVSLPPATKGISQDDYVKKGKLVIQDKASCFPSQILSNIWNDRISNQCRGQFIDGCSAPGNKTSHLASCLLQSSHYTPPMHVIHAFEKNKGRFQLLRQRMEQCQVASVVQSKQQDFLSIDVSKYSNVTHILMDPSCSGSGIVRNLERFTEETSPVTTASKDTAEEEGSDIPPKNRILQLQSFQLLVLKKAVSFPNVQFVVYSTCSIHQEENEIVVSKLLESEEGRNWELMIPIGFDSWERRGQVVEGISSEDAKKMIRCLPVDGMNGFFVAALKRKQLRSVDLTVSVESESSSKAAEDTQGGSTTSRKHPASTSTLPVKVVSNQGFRVSNRKKRKFSKKL